jgi:hypothetical protein
LSFYFLERDLKERSLINAGGLIPEGVHYTRKQKNLPKLVRVSGRLLRLFSSAPAGLAKI